MPILGFDLDKKVKGKEPVHEFEAIEYYHPSIKMGINSPRSLFKDHIVHRIKPGSLHHLAFKADSWEQGNQLYQKNKEIGATIVDPPQFYPQHGESYYALFFQGPGWDKI
jgi:hypothetical protein